MLDFILSRRTKDYFKRALEAHERAAQRAQAALLTCDARDRAAYQQHLLSAQREVELYRSLLEGTQ